MIYELSSIEDIWVLVIAIKFEQVTTNLLCLFTAPSFKEKITSHILNKHQI